MNTVDRIAKAIRKNPEGLLILGAGVALMLRNAGTIGESFRSSNDSFEPYRYHDGVDRKSSSGLAAKVSAATDRVSAAADDVKNYVSETAQDLTDKASQYGRDLTDTASEYGRSATERTRKAAQSALRSAEDVIDTHPMSLALAGIAAGCLAAAVFPSTRFERETLGPLGRRAAADTGEFVKAAAAERVARAAAKATDQIKEAVSEQRLNAGTFTDVAKDFASNLAGRDEAPNKRQPGTRDAKAQL